MTLLNAGASRAALTAGVRAATDVTGFGLLGHLHRMLAASGAAARIYAAAVPLLPGAAELAAAGFVSGGTRANTERMRGFAVLDAAVPAELAVLLHDAQTSGGLLLAARRPRRPRCSASCGRRDCPPPESARSSGARAAMSTCTWIVRHNGFTAGYRGAVTMRTGVVRAVAAACLLAALAPRLRRRRAEPGARAGHPARHVVVVGISGLRWSDVSPAATPALWRLAGQGSVGSLVDYAVLPLTCPADALAHAERGRPGAVRPHQRRLRGVSRGDSRRDGCRGAGHGLAGGLQQPVPQQPRLGPAGQRRPWLRHRRRPGRRAGAGRLRRARRVLPALGRGPHRGGAGPLPADRRGPGHHRICRTVLGPRLGRRRTRADRGGPAGRLDAARHRARGHHQAAAPAARPGRRPRLPGRPAGLRLHPAARPGGAHRPDPDRARLARPGHGRPARSARRSPAATGAA